MLASKIFRPSIGSVGYQVVLGLRLLMVSPVILESFRRPCTVQQLARLLIDLHLEMSRWFRWLPEICLDAAPHIEPVKNIDLCSKSLNVFPPIFFEYQSLFEIFMQWFVDIGCRKGKKNLQEKARDIFRLGPYLILFGFLVLALTVHFICGQVFCLIFFTNFVQDSLVVF